MRIHELLTLNEARTGTFTPEKKQLTLKLWDQGKGRLSDEKIANEVGISRIAVSNFLNAIWKESHPNEPRPTLQKVPITDQQKTQILNLWNKDPRPSDEEIANKVGVSCATVGRFLNKEWEELHPNTTRPTLQKVPITDQQKTQILDLWQEGKSGLSDDEIANKVGVSHATVSRFLNKEWGELYPNTTRPTLYTRFSEKDIETIRNLYMDGYGATHISSSNLLEVSRSDGTIRSLIRRQPDYETLLRPRHLENLKILASTSQAEIDFFNDLQEKLKQAFPNNIINLERTPKVFRDKGKLFYSLDGLINEKLVVEFNGTLWHADPLVTYKRGDRQGQQKYPDDKFVSSLGVTAGEKRQYDNERTKWLANHYGIEPVIIWEREWGSNPKECIDRVIDRVSKIV